MPCSRHENNNHGHLKSSPANRDLLQSGSAKVCEVKELSSRFHNASVRARSVAPLIAAHGADAKLTDLLATLANCPKARSVSVHDRWKARFTSSWRRLIGPERATATVVLRLAAEPTAFSLEALGMYEPVEVPKREIAREFLDAAIEFYLADTNLICAIHLAGAAEELLGGHLEEESPDDPERQRISTFAWKAEKALKSKPEAPISDAEARKSVNQWRNQIKHMNNRDDAMATFEYGLMAAAKFHIDFALTNFRKLNLPETPAIRKFEEHQRRKYDSR
jgi:hypothetical protein